MSKLQYEPTLWIYEYFIEKIPSFDVDAKSMTRSMAIDACESCRVAYKRRMFAEIVRIVDQNIEEV
jgi:hypothetical protein